MWRRRDGVVAFRRPATPSLNLRFTTFGNGSFTMLAQGF
jgi:hypothetical protein